MKKRLSIACLWMASALILLTAPPLLADSTPVQLGDTTHPHKFIVTSSADHITGLTGQASALTAALKERKNAGSTGSPTGTITEEDSTNFPGVYDYTPTSSDVNTYGEANFHTSVSGSDPIDFSFIVVAYNPYDPSLLGLTGVATGATQASQGTTLSTVNTNVGTINTNVGTINTNVSTINTNVAALPSASANATAVWAAGTRTTTGGTITSVTGSVGSVTGSVGSISGVTFPANFGTFSVDSSGRVLLQPSQPSVTIPTVTTVGTLTTNSDKTGYALTSGEHTNIASDVLGATAASFNTAGTIGQKINTTGSADDPWTTSLPGSYTSGQAGYIVGHNLDSPISSVSAATVAALMSASFITLPGSATISGTGEVLTQKQIQALGDAVSGGDNVTSGPAVANGTATVTYYLRGQAHSSSTIVEIATVHFDANKNQTSRTVLIAQPFPVVN